MINGVKWGMVKSFIEQTTILVVCSIKVALRSNSFHENNTIYNMPPKAA
jgi:hypothetical protein